MVSAALTEWNTDRTARIDDLLYAHRQTGGAGRGRRWRTEQLNWALVLRVAAEFQGFARALHDEGVDYFTSQVGYLNASLSGIVRTRMLVLRDLDRGNASPGALGSDFGRLGMSLWPELNVRYTRAASWNTTLEALNTARNGIAHDDQTKFAKARSLPAPGDTVAVEWGLDSVDATVVAVYPGARGPRVTVSVPVLGPSGEHLDETVVTLPLEALT